MSTACLALPEEAEKRKLEDEWLRRKIKTHHFFCEPISPGDLARAEALVKDRIVKEKEGGVSAKSVLEIFFGDIWALCGRGWCSCPTCEARRENSTVKNCSCFLCLMKASRGRTI